MAEVPPEPPDPVGRLGIDHGLVGLFCQDNLGELKMGKRPNIQLIFTKLLGGVNLVEGLNEKAPDFFEAPIIPSILSQSKTDHVLSNSSLKTAISDTTSGFEGSRFSLIELFVSLNNNTK